MSAHTPGPWACPIAKGGGPASVVMSVIPTTAGSLYVAEAHFREDPEEQKANARLIAAAPDLLVALQELLTLYVQLVNSGDCGNWDANADAEVVQARNVIAKVEGR